MKRLLLGVVASAAAMTIVPNSLAGPITGPVSINFNCGGPGNGAGTMGVQGTAGGASQLPGFAVGSNFCTDNGGSVPTVVMTKWTESGFVLTPDVTSTPASGTLASTAGKTWWNPFQGDLPPGMSNGHGGTETDNLTSGNGNGIFEFDSFSLGGASYTGQVNYTVTGYDGSTEEFTFSGEICTASNPCGSSVTYYSVSNPDDFTKINDLQITLSSLYGADYVDNIDLDIPRPTFSSVPEPSALYLLPGFLLVGAWAFFRRRSEFPN